MNTLMYYTVVVFGYNPFNEENYSPFHIFDVTTLEEAHKIAAKYQPYSNGVVTGHRVKE
jgi:hypothetical protein